MKQLLTTFMLCMTISGCAAFQQAPATGLSTPRTLGLMPFAYTSEKITGQLAADQIALEMIAKGYYIIDRSFTTSVVNESKFYTTGLSEDTRRAFQAQNIAAILFGSVNNFGCETVNSTSLFGSYNKNSRCTVTLTAKIAECSTGRLLWGITISESAEGENITAEEVMKTLIQKASSNGALPVPLSEKNTATAGGKVPPDSK